MESRYLGALRHRQAGRAHYADRRRLPCIATNFPSRSSAKHSKPPALYIPVISLSFKDLGEVNPGFKITPKMLLQAIYALCYGDLLMMTLYRTRPYEIEPGAATICSTTGWPNENPSWRAA